MTRKFNYASPSRRLAAGKASNFIKPIEEFPAGTRVVLWERVSKRAQGRNGQNIHDQDLNLWTQAQELGLKVVGVFDHEGSGFGANSWTLLHKAAAYAARHDAILFAETTPRLIRHPAFHTKLWPDAQARDADLQVLPTNVVIATDLHPDASPKEVRAYDRRRGQQMKNRKGGRPKAPGYKKRIRLRMKAKVIGLHPELSQREIAKQTGVPRATVQRWIAE